MPKQPAVPSKAGHSVLAQLPVTLPGAVLNPPALQPPSAKNWRSSHGAVPWEDAALQEQDVTLEMWPRGWEGTTPASPETVLGR